VSVVETSVLITNRVGLHARPARLLVQTAAQFRSQISLQCGERKANAKSIVGVLKLGASKGVTLTVRAEGDDAEEALHALTALAHRGFDDVE
jgi:phosphotransferase system HPr (HPr) family protein